MLPKLMPKADQQDLLMAMGSFTVPTHADMVWVLRCREQSYE